MRVALVLSFLVLTTANAVAFEGGGAASTVASASAVGALALAAVVGRVARRR